MSMLEAMRAMKKKMKEEAAAAAAAKEEESGSDVSEDGGHRPAVSVDPGLADACAAAAKFVREGRDPTTFARRRVWYAAEKCAPRVLRRLLGAGDVAALHASARALADLGHAARNFKDATSESTIGHSICYLHAGGFFQRECPELFARLEAAMRAHAGADWPSRDEALHVRCIEHHTYTAESGLLMKGHRDNDSVLTLSALLSEDGDHDGGRFVTYDAAGGPVPHDLKRGDAILFSSEKLHNIERVTRGVRRALVVELWREPANAADRFK